MTGDTVEFEVASVDSTTETFEVELDDGHVAERDEPVIHATGYTEAGEYHHARIRGFEPYFYVPYEQLGGDAPSEIRRFEPYDDTGDEFRSVRGDRVARAVVRHPGDVRDARDRYEQTWESDVRYPQRFITDLGLTSGLRVPADEEYVDLADVGTCEVDADWRVHYMDIEVDDRNGFPQDGDEEILCITAYDSHEQEYVVWIQGGGDSTMGGMLGEDEDRLHDDPTQIRWYEDEVEMLQSYFAYIQVTNPSIITGWNSDGFDIPYLEDRCDTLEDERDADLSFDIISPLFDAYCNDWGPSIKGIVSLDLMDAYKSRQYTEKDSYRLEAVASDEIGVGKEQYVGTVGQLWEDDPAALVDYNLRDVELLVELDRRQSLIDFAREIKRFVGCQLDDAIIESTVADRYLLSLCHGDVVLPPAHSREGEDFEGATVFEAADGLHEWIAALDLASLYPMSMLTLNASPETKVDPEEFDGPTRQSPNGIHFRTDQAGITRDVITNLLGVREEKKELRDQHDPDSETYEVFDLQQYAVKVIMNSLYGVMGWTRFRLYDIDVASAVTATGRAVIERTGEIVEGLGRSVLYGDTDSVLLDVADLAGDGTDALVDDVEEIAEEINAAYDEFAADALDADEHWFDIEFEKLYRRYFQAGKKKRYSGHIVWKEGKDVDDVDITGFEYQRSDVAPFTKRVQLRTLELIVEGADRDDVVEYLREERQKLVEHRVPIEDVGIPTGIGQDLYDYDVDTHASRAAKYGNLVLGTAFARGSKPKRYYLDGVNPALFAQVEGDGIDPDRDALYREFEERPFVIGVPRAEQLPGAARLDWDETERKVFRLPIRRIVDSYDVEWAAIENESQQSGLGAYV